MEGGEEGKMRQTTPSRGYASAELRRIGETLNCGFAMLDTEINCFAWVECPELPQWWVLAGRWEKANIGMGWGGGMGYLVCLGCIYVYIIYAHLGSYKSVFSQRPTSKRFDCTNWRALAPQDPVNKKTKDAHRQDRGMLN